MSDKSIVLVGAGAVGSLLAAALSENGHSFTWIVRNPDRRFQLNKLVVQFPGGSQDYSLEKCSMLPSIDDANSADRLIIAVKAHQVKGVLGQFNREHAEHALVVANGLHSSGYHLGLLYGGAFLKSGVLVTGDTNDLLIGNLGPGMGLAGEYSSLLGCRFVNTDIADPDNTSPDGILYSMWMKLAVNCIVNPLTALLDVDNGELLGRLHGPLAVRLADEISEVMKHAARGQFPAPSTTDILTAVKSVLKATRSNSSSMREDVRSGRETEISSLNQAIVEAGRKAGIECFVNSAVSEMVSLLSGRKGPASDRTDNA